MGAPPLVFEEGLAADVQSIAALPGSAFGLHAHARTTLRIAGSADVTRGSFKSPQTLELVGKTRALFAVRTRSSPGFKIDPRTCRP